MGLPGTAAQGAQASCRRSIQAQRRRSGGVTGTRGGFALLSPSCEHCYNLLSPLLRSSSHGRKRARPRIRSHARSEERRVGKEGRTRWWPHHLKKKKKRELNDSETQELSYVGNKLVCCMSGH